MSLDVQLSLPDGECVFDANITHNMNTMAKEAGIYTPLWHPEELGITTAKELIEPLSVGLALLESDPERFKVFEPANKWGSYAGFVAWLDRLLVACILNPNTTFSVDI